MFLDVFLHQNSFFRGNVCHGQYGFRCLSNVVGPALHDKQNVRIYLLIRHSSIIHSLFIGSIHNSYKDLLCNVIVFVYPLTLNSTVLNINFHFLSRLIGQRRYCNLYLWYGGSTSRTGVNLNHRTRR